VTPLEPQTPPAGEDIHLPGPSVLPVLTALGITIALIGATTFWELSIIGGILTIGCIVRWIKDTRTEVDQLPLDAEER
jgi:hypothetical protein